MNGTAIIASLDSLVQATTMEALDRMLAMEDHNLHRLRVKKKRILERYHLRVAKLAETGDNREASTRSVGKVDSELRNRRRRSRVVHLARGFLRGQSYRAMENRSNASNPLDVLSLAHLVGIDSMNQLAVWLAEEPREIEPDERPRVRLNIDRTTLEPLTREERAEYCQGLLAEAWKALNASST